MHKCKGKIDCQIFEDNILTVYDFFCEFHVFLGLPLEICNTGRLELIFPHQEDVGGVYGFYSVIWMD